MAPLSTHDSAVLSCLHGCLVFLHKHFPPQSPVSYPLRLSPHSPQLTSLDSSTIPTLQLPAFAPSRGLALLSGVCMAVARVVCVILFCLDYHRSAASLSGSNVSPLSQTVALMWGSDPCFSSPACQGEVQSYLFSFAPTSFTLLGFAWFYTLFSGWSGTPACSQLVVCKLSCV